MKTWFLRLQPLFLLLAGGLIAWLLSEQWEALRSHHWQVQGGWLLLASGLTLASWALEIGIWQRLLYLVGGQLPYLAATRIWFLSAIVRYIPGNIWQPLSMTFHCQQWGIRPEATITSVLCFQLVTLLAVIPISTIYLVIQQQQGQLPAMLAGWSASASVLVLLPVGLFLVTPRIFFALINWALGKIGRPPLNIQISSVQLSTLLLLAMLNWLLWGAAFAALTYALSDYSVPRMLQLAPHLVVLYVVAYAVGILSLLTPSGFGVREGALYLLLTPLLGTQLITVAALAMRAWTTLGEVMLAGLSAFLGRQRAKL